MRKLIFVLTVFSVLIVKAEDVTIEGTVYDDQGNSLSGVTIAEVGQENTTTSDVLGHYTIQVSGPKSKLAFSLAGMQPQEVKVGTKRKIDVVLIPAIAEELPEIVVDDFSLRSMDKKTGSVAGVQIHGQASLSRQAFRVMDYEPVHHTEEYDAIEENIFHRITDKPLSTFSIDVDAASYSNMRRFLNMGQMPPKDAVRIEEMINYFHYGYEGPKDQHPFAIHTAKQKAPWNEDHLLVKIGIQGKKLEMDELPPSNVVFLLDVSGSMNAPNKLPLLKSSMKMLVNELRQEDKISIVVYAGAAGLVLPPTAGADKKKILQAIENLNAGGSTAGGAGIQLAYKVAEEQLIAGGNNRVILATDGDFNVGMSSNAEMQRLIEEKRETGVFLTVLGFGNGNYKDSKMETLADKGNGNYAYIDNIMEAKKVLVTEFGGTLFTIAKDVKIQVEFNPHVVQAYRLIGYENRQLQAEDFNDDQKDAGELGSGHTVTALYEIIPVGVKSEFVKEVDALKYQNKEVTGDTQELLTVKFRYKEPDGSKSLLISRTLLNDGQEDGDDHLNWAANVAGFGMLLRDSEFKGNLTYAQLLAAARKAAANDEYGYRSEFIQLVDIARTLSQ